MDELIDCWHGGICPSKYKKPSDYINRELDVVFCGMCKKYVFVETCNCKIN